MFAIRWSRSVTFFALMSLAGNTTAWAQSGAIRGYPAGATVQQTPYYSAYYPVQYGYAYPPQPAYAGVPQTAYYAPATTATYAAARPAANYTLSPAGSASGGSEAYAYYGQSTPLNYVAPTYTGYQVRMVQVPVTYYRPYTVYQPGAAAPVTCQRATCGTTCQPQTRRWFSCLDWFRKQPCGAPAPAAVPVAAVPVAVPRATCYSNNCYAGSCTPAACGTPYYNTVPPANVVPTIPGTTVVPGTTVAPGTTIVPSTVSPPSSIRGILNPPAIVPPPGTRTIVPGTGTFPGTSPGTTLPGGVRDGADVTPRIVPGTAVPPPSSFPGTSGSGANYRPDSQSHSTTPASAESPYRGPSLTQPTVSEPSLGPRRSVRPVPDPAATQPREPSTPANRAPQLIAPNDRTAVFAPRFRAESSAGKIAATWPEKTAAASVAASRADVQPVSRHVPTPPAKVWDDTLWQSAAK